MSLRELLRSMINNNFHQLFFVNDVGVPTNVITLADVLNYFLELWNDLSNMKQL
jgi:predicted transcriptional regulator